MIVRFECLAPAHLVFYGMRPSWLEAILTVAWFASAMPHCAYPNRWLTSSCMFLGMNMLIHPVLSMPHAKIACKWEYAVRCHHFWPVAHQKAGLQAQRQVQAAECVTHMQQALAPSWA